MSKEDFYVLAGDQSDGVPEGSGVDITCNQWNDKSVHLGFTITADETCKSDVLGVTPDVVDWPHCYSDDYGAYNQNSCSLDREAHMQYPGWVSLYYSTQEECMNKDAPPMFYVNGNDNCLQVDDNYKPDPDHPSGRDKALYYTMRCNMDSTVTYMYYDSFGCNGKVVYSFTRKIDAVDQNGNTVGAFNQCNAVAPGGNVQYSYQYDFCMVPSMMKPQGALRGD